MPVSLADGRVIMKNPNQVNHKCYPYPRRRALRALLKAGINLNAHLLTQIRIKGKEYLPADGPLIVVINHFHFLDAAVLIGAAPWPLEFLADFEMPNVPPVMKLFPDLYGTYDVAQGTANLDALHAAVAVLAQNGVMGVFPEGRLHQPPLNPALPGAAFLALRTGAPILPVGIYTDRSWDIFGTIRETGRRLKVTCQFGPVFGPLEAENTRRPGKDEMDWAGKTIMAAIARLLPPEMQGEAIAASERH